MAYPDKVLSNDEKVVEHLHPHWITLVPATLWFLVICAAGGLGIGYAPSHGTFHSIVVGAVIVVALVLLVWLSLVPWVSWRTTHYVFTDHRVLIRRGVLHHVGRDISLQRISDVGFSQTLWDRIVKAGTLTIESAGEHGQEALENIPRSEQQQQLLNRLIETDSQRRARQSYPGYPPPGYPQPGAPMQNMPYPPGYPQGQQYPPTQQYPPQ